VGRDDLRRARRHCRVHRRPPPPLRDRAVGLLAGDRAALARPVMEAFKAILSSWRDGFLAQHGRQPSRTEIPLEQLSELTPVRQPPSRIISPLLRLLPCILALWLQLRSDDKLCCSRAVPAAAQSCS
jgi:hypothetical protein